MKEKEKYYTVKEAAILLGRTVQTIYRWKDAGKLNGLNNPLTGRLIFSKEDIARAKEWV